jgi:hypothetical protein
MKSTADSRSYSLRSVKDEDKQLVGGTLLFGNPLKDPAVTVAIGEPHSSAPLTLKLQARSADAMPHYSFHAADGALNKELTVPLIITAYTRLRLLCSRRGSCTTR